MRKKVLIVAAGGGHTGYGHSLSRRLHEKGVKLYFLVPKGDNLSAERLGEMGPVRFLTKPLEPKTPSHMFFQGFIQALCESIKLINQNYDAIVCMGSNFCIAPSIVAMLKRIPIVNVESPVRFVKASKTARLLQPISTVTALHWPEQKRLLNGTVVGPMLPTPEIKPWDGGYILVTGGSFGHKLLFDTISQSDIENVVLQTGPIAPAPYVERHPEWEIFQFSTNFHEYIAGSRVVVTHYGSTIIEALVYGKPVVITPNPEWTRTAGIDDARYMAKRVNAILVPNITVSNLVEAIREAEKRKPPSYINGCIKLADIILKL